VFAERGSLSVERFFVFEILVTIHFTGGSKVFQLFFETLNVCAYFLSALYGAGCLYGDFYTAGCIAHNFNF